MGHILQALKQLEAKQAFSPEAESPPVPEQADVVNQPPPVAEAAVEVADPSAEISDAPPADSVVRARFVGSRLGHGRFGESPEVSLRLFGRRR